MTLKKLALPVLCIIDDDLSSAFVVRTQDEADDLKWRNRDATDVEIMFVSLVATLEASARLAEVERDLKNERQRADAHLSAFKEVERERDALKNAAWLAKQHREQREAVARDMAEALRGTMALADGFTPVDDEPAARFDMLMSDASIALAAWDALTKGDTK